MNILKLKGKSASPGFVLGKALVLTTEKLRVEKRTISSPESELVRLREAVAIAKTELELVRDQARLELGADKAEIFEAHLLILEDPELLETTESLIKEQMVNAEFALNQTADQFIAIFEAMENDYMKERVADIRDVTSRILRVLSGQKNIDLAGLTEDVILVAHDLTPSDTAAMSKKHVQGFLTNIGGKTSHTAIMARTLEIPAVLGLHDITGRVKTGDFLVFNGETGEVVLNPDAATISHYQKERETFLQLKNELQSFVGLESVTLDGRRVKLVANIGTPDDLGIVEKNDAEGIGLFRTEFLFMDRDTMPTEEEQFKSYKTVLERLNPRSVIIRTLDIGGDKAVPYLKIPHEENPFLGLRAIRYCLRETEVFRIQLRALLRASKFGRLGIMFPMICNLDEFLKAKAIYEEVKADLRREGIEYSQDIELGIMIEIPSAAIMSDVLAKHVDFMSIGTNDLIQYTCAVDRMNQTVSDLYDPYNPAVLRLIKLVIDNGNAEGIHVGMCGEMAGMKDLIPVLLDMGLHEFSMSPASILQARKTIRSLTYSKTQQSLNPARTKLSFPSLPSAEI